MTAIELLRYTRDVKFACPQSKEGLKVGLPSNSELHRWLKNGSVNINGQKPQPSDEIGSWPPDTLIFFAGSKKKTTLFLVALPRKTAKEEAR